MIGWLIEERWAELLVRAGHAAPRTASAQPAAGGLGAYRQAQGMAQVPVRDAHPRADRAGLERRAQRATTTLRSICRGQSVRRCWRAGRAHRWCMERGRRARSPASSVVHAPGDCARRPCDRAESFARGSLTGTSLHAGRRATSARSGDGAANARALAEAGLENSPSSIPARAGVRSVGPRSAMARSLGAGRCGLRSVVNYGPGEDQLAHEAEASQ